MGKRKKPSTAKKTGLPAAEPASAKRAKTQKAKHDKDPSVIKRSSPRNAGSGFILEFKACPKYFDKDGKVISGPSYKEDSTDSKYGGVNTKAYCGAAAYRTTGTDADSNLPEITNSVKKYYKEKALIAGHLLNADFGGSGTDNGNITILSSNGNSKHKSFDEPLKLAFGQLKKLYEQIFDLNLNVKLKDYKFRIFINVQVDKKKRWEKAKYATQHLYCFASYTSDKENVLARCETKQSALASEIADNKQRLNELKNNKPKRSNVNYENNLNEATKNLKAAETLQDKIKKFKDKTLPKIEEEIEERIKVALTGKLKKVDKKSYVTIVNAKAPMS